MTHKLRLVPMSDLYRCDMCGQDHRNVATIEVPRKNGTPTEFRFCADCVRETLTNIAKGMT